MSLFLHWLHLLAAIAWVGGITYLVFVFFPIFPSVDPVARAQLAPRLVRRFLVLVWSAAAVLLITGFYRVLAVQHMTTATSWLHNGPYGHTLMTKLFLYLLMVGLAVHINFILYPRLRSHMQEHTASAAPTACTVCARLMQKTRRMMWIGWGMSLLVVFLAARLRGA